MSTGTPFSLETHKKLWKKNNNKKKNTFWNDNFLWVKPKLWQNNSEINVEHMKVIAMGQNIKHTQLLFVLKMEVPVFIGVS